ncbi:MAG: hypothetical protein ACRBCI_03855, partial [Cellvibrionaceae bacterium]
MNKTPLIYTVKSICALAAITVVGCAGFSSSQGESNNRNTTDTLPVSKKEIIVAVNSPKKIVSNNVVNDQNNKNIVVDKVTIKPIKKYNNTVFINKNKKNSVIKKTTSINEKKKNIKPVPIDKKEKESSVINLNIDPDNEKMKLHSKSYGSKKINDKKSEFFLKEKITSKNSDEKKYKINSSVADLTNNTAVENVENV